ncbi:MAG: tripartite tricarboxylate transporter TctB family protein [Deltaproteobacteria bacterium]|nr:tripartite tricarboxylate transporter TctB family protein [Deltaproteobacteria bacterium]
MSRKEKASSLFLMAAGLAISYGGHDLDLGTVTNPGSGFIFFWLGLIIFGLAVTVLVQASRKPAQTVEGALQVQWKKVLTVIASLCAYAFTFSFLGFILATIILLVFLFKAFESQRWSTAIVGAVLGSLGAYAIFELWLGCQLPQGFLGIG